MDRDLEVMAYALFDDELEIWAENDDGELVELRWDRRAHRLREWRRTCRTMNAHAQ